MISPKFDIYKYCREAFEGEKSFRIFNEFLGVMFAGLFIAVAKVECEYFFPYTKLNEYGEVILFIGSCLLYLMAFPLKFYIQDISPIVVSHNLNDYSLMVINSID